MKQNKNIPLNVHFYRTVELNKDDIEIREYVDKYFSYARVNYFYKHNSNIAFYYNNGNRL